MGVVSGGGWLGGGGWLMGVVRGGGCCSMTPKSCITMILCCLFMIHHKIMELLSTLYSQSLIKQIKPLIRLP